MQVVAVGDIIYVHSTKEHWELAQIPEAESAMVALNPKNGAIEVLVGGFNFQKVSLTEPLNQADNQAPALSHLSMPLH